MKCFNCGNELKDGTLVCPRCGKRQPGGAGGSGGSGGSNGKGGFGSGKIVALVASILVVVGLSIFGINHFRNSNGSQFTHDTTFEKDNLTVQNENTLRYREVKNNKTFRVGSSKKFVDINLTDDFGNKVDFIVDNTSKPDIFLIKPNGVWNEGRTYHLSLGEDTYFTDEDMHQFDNVYYTIEREKASEIKVKDDIKDMSTQNDVYIYNNVEVGDIILKKDENNNLVCKKVSSKNNGSVSYEEPPLNEVFEGMNLNDEFEADYDSIKWNSELGIKMAHNVVESPFFSALIQTVYADGNSDNIYRDAISNVTKYVSCEPYKKAKGLGAKIVITLPELDDTAFDSIKINGTTKITFDISNSFDFKPNIDFRTKDNVSFDLQFYSYPSSTIKIDINGEANVTDEAVKAAWDVINDYDSFIDLCTIDIPIPAASINAGVVKGGLAVSVPMGFVPKFSAEVNFNYAHERASTIKFGIGLVGGELKPDYLNEMTKDTIDLHMDGQLYASLGFRIEPQVKFELSANVDLLVAEGHAAVVASIGFGAEVGPYVMFKGEYNGKWDRKNNTSDVKGNCDLELGVYCIFDIVGNFKLNIGYSVIDLGGTFLSFVKGEPSREMNTTELVDIDNRLSFNLLNEHYPLIQIGGFIDNEESGIATAIAVGPVGSTMQFGPYVFRVVDKNDIDGTALIVSVDGVEARKFMDSVNNNDMNISYTWSGSTLRKYLNEEFIKNFSDLEKTSIHETMVKAERNSKYSLDPGKDTKDKIFILSESELNRYFKSNADRQLKASGRAIAGGAYISKETDPNRNRVEGNTIYWVRNTGNMSMNAVAVNSDGSINLEGAPVSREDVCVRPAIWVIYAVKDTKVSERLKNANKGIVNSTGVSGGGGHGGR